MLKIMAVLALAASLTGCVVAPAYGPYGYAPAPAYGYAPGYVVAPSVSIGVGGGGDWGRGGGWHGR